jgi:hypothetical protein
MEILWVVVVSALILLIFEVIQLILVLSTPEIRGKFFIFGYVLILVLSTLHATMSYVFLGGAFDVLSFFVMYFPSFFPILIGLLWLRKVNRSNNRGNP